MEPIVATASIRTSQTALYNGSGTESALPLSSSICHRTSGKLASYRIYLDSPNMAETMVYISIIYTMAETAMH